MQALLIIARILHVLSGIMWVGVMVFNARFLGPALNDIGPDAGKVMQALVKRGFINFLPGVATMTIISGAYLYWHDSVGLDSTFTSSRPGMTFGLGAVLAVIAYIIGMVVIRPAIKVSLSLGPQLAGASEADRAVMMAQMGAAREKSTMWGRIVAWLLILAAVAMAVARYT
ncbi:MAG TPA: hypothetical protein VF042_02160 [Gemmatimonadaceae bacterium]